ncbi:MAG: sterol desaturase family protein [Desulfobacteraceae bacterium]|nr:sterol desaturase family protein [Desulfobacteraceae bacterium]
MDRERRKQILSRRVPGWISGLLVLGSLGALLLLERRRPLRERKTGESKLRRDGRNLAMAALSAAAIGLVEKPVVEPLAHKVVDRRWGLLQRRPLPVPLELFLTIALLDYTLYIWHVLTHKVPLLWRFHQSHHVDLDMDATTAVRFHFGEMVLSAPWRAAQVLLIGSSPLGLALWQTITTVEILFHHSNTRLPAGFERYLGKLIVTPRMHGIHHSIVREETDSNWSTIFTWPDALHRTLRLNVPQREITIGVAAYQDPAELTLGKIIALPLTASRPSWRLVDDGTPVRRPAELPNLPRTALAG